MDNRSWNRLFERGGKAERALLLNRFQLIQQKWIGK
jgi:hypothetical protein